MAEFEWRAIAHAGVPGIIQCSKYRTPYAVSRTTTVSLGNRRFLVYSPGEPCLEHTPIPPDADVCLLVPNRAHTSGINAWRRRYAKASIYSAESLMSGAADWHAQDVRSLDLPPHVEIHVLPTNELHEVWVSVDQGETVYWIVGDALMNLAQFSPIPLRRLLQRVYGLKLGLWVPRSFRASVTNRPLFRQWAREKFSRDRVHALIPCHGEIYEETDCGEKISALFDKRFA